jgi:hypothetical protein
MHVVQWSASGPGRFISGAYCVIEGAKRGGGALFAYWGAEKISSCRESNSSVRGRPIRWRGQTAIQTLGQRRRLHNPDPRLSWLTFATLTAANIYSLSTGVTQLSKHAILTKEEEVQGWSEGH